MAKKGKDDLSKAEPSRWQAGAPGHYPNFSASKMRRVAASGLGELHALQARVARMMRTQPEDPRNSPPPHVTTVTDVTRGLGIDPSLEQRIQKVVQGTTPNFDQKSQTQRLMLARSSLLSFMRESVSTAGVPSDTRGELVRRATAYWKRNFQTDYGKTPTVRHMNKSATGPIPVLRLNLFQKAAHGGKYYRRIPTGNPKRPWKYYYTREAYERAHGKDGHLHGPEVRESRKKKKESKQLSLFDQPTKPTPKPKAPEPKPEPKPEPVAAAKPKQRISTARFANRVVQGMLSDTPGAIHSSNLDTLEGAISSVLAFIGGLSFLQAKMVFTNAGIERDSARDQLKSLPEDSDDARRFRRIERLTRKVRSAALKRVQATAGEFGDSRLPKPGTEAVAPKEESKVPAAENPALKALKQKISGLARYFGSEEAVLAANPELKSQLESLESGAQSAPEAPKVADSVTGHVGTPKAGEAPPGGWTEEDRVPVDPEREKRMRARVEARKERARAATEAKAVHQKLRFSPGDKIKVDGKEYTVDSVSDEGGFGRRLILTPTSARAKRKRELEIDTRGEATIRTLNGSRQDVGKIEGGTQSESNWETAKDNDKPKQPKLVVQTGETKKDDPPRPVPTPVVSTSTTTSGPSGEAVVKPKAPKKPRTVTAPADTPRGQAERNFEPSEYVNDRASKIEQRGEDVSGSARHKASVWKGLRESLDSPQAAKLFRRTFLEREKPVEFVSAYQGSTGDQPMSLMFLHTLTQRFPATPPKISSSRRSDELGTWWAHKQMGSGYRMSSIELLNMGTRWRSKTAEEKAVIQTQYDAAQRTGYYEAYEAMHATLTKHVQAVRSGNGAFGDMLRAVREDISAHVREADRKGDKFKSASLRQLLQQGWGRNKTSALMQVAKVAQKVKAEVGTGDASVDRFREIGMAMAEGQSLREALGEAKRTTKRFDISKAYNTDVMVRNGPPSEYQDTTQGLDLLDGSAGGKFGMRGVQWGKSVTDDERAHHLKSCVDSFSDLTDVLGLPSEMASYNGRLAIAIGARGKGSALAHYEPALKIINLTRAKGAGSLAHEWGHFFDFMVNKLVGGSEKESAFASTRNSDNPVIAGMRKLRMSAEYQAMCSRVSSVASQEFNSKAAEYWSSSEEIFARSFERYVQRKLEKQGRQNTYLVGVEKAVSGDDGLWPTNAEVDAMTPHFDAIFAAFRNSDLLHKAMQWLGYVSPDYAHLMRGKPKFTIPRGM